MADIELPQLGESVTEGTITRWFKAVGDQVTEDEPLFEVSTDKVDSEVPSPVSGYVAEILVEEGDTVDVGTKLAVVSAEAPGGPAAEPVQVSDPAEGDAPVPPAEPAASTSEPTEGQTPVPAAEPAPAASAPALAPAEPAAAPAPAPAEPAAAPAPPPAQAPPSPPAPVAAPPAQAPAAASPAAGGGSLLSPVVRRLVEEAGVDPGEITGTGLGGRVTRSDVERHLAARSPESAPVEAPPASRPPEAAGAGAPPAAPSRPEPAHHGADSSVPFNKIRKITAEHMVRSLGTSAHAYVSVQVDYERIERVRRAHKAQFKADEGTSLTYLPFVSRALVDAIAEFPLLNASVGDGELIVHGDVHLGVAVDLDDEGLIVPVVHHAQDKRLRAIAREVAELADRAHHRRLSADDITGGTVTITNVGFSGTEILLPIINQPQVMILSTDGVDRRPVVVTDGSGSESIAIHSVGNLTLGWDHRAFDGAYAARFLARVREILETRDWEAEL